ncbi:MAG: STAS domain-containing protein [Rhodobacteraceae bacterium]|nr:STAS domain-containing protein [Paracoccaceae bacterium]
MKLSITPHGAALLIRIEEHRLDAAVALGFKEAMREAAEQPGTPVLLDMSQVDFLDSSGLGSVVAAMKLLGPGRALELCALTANVAKVFRLTRMDSVFTLHDRVPPVAAPGSGGCGGSGTGGSGSGDAGSARATA